MATSKMFPLVLKMSLPAMFSMLIQSLYNVVDSIFVSRYSPDSFTAVNFAFPIARKKMQKKHLLPGIKSNNWGVM